MTPYEVLGVTSRATAREITAKYRILAQIYHPDRFAAAPKAVREEAERLMASLNEAYALARRGFNGHMAGSEPGPAPSHSGSSFRAPAPAQPWHEQVRERAAQARRATEAKRARQRMANNGQARAQPKERSRTAPRNVLFGMGEALHTGNLTCRSCRSVQWLPAGWEHRLDEVNYHCSFCSQVLLAR